MPVVMITVDNQFSEELSGTLTTDNECSLAGIFVSLVILSLFRVEEAYCVVEGYC